MNLKLKFSLVFTLILSSFCFFANASLAQMPIGMNVPGITYYDPSLLFNDAMKTANFRANGIDINDLNSDKFANFPKDANGYPTQVPYTMDGHSYGYVAFINSFYKGDYVLLYDGIGQLTLGNVSNSLVNGVRHLNMPGIKTNIWITVTSVTTGNHIRNIRLIPAEYLNNEAAMPTFRSDFIAAVQPFHSLRFMDLTKTNNSVAKEWADRPKPGDLTQAGPQGVAWEYAIQLSNQLKEDPWICIPHQASDDYIANLAQLFKDNLDPSLKLYIEFSNEMWNWPFQQAGYVLNAAPGHPNPYVSADLAAIKAAGGNFPEMDAYMMARMFRIFGQVWETQSSRLVRVATGQAAWYANSGRILKYLFNTNGIGADALAVGGYFYFNSADHNVWNAMDPASVTPEMVLQSADAYYASNTAVWTRGSAAYAKQYGVDFMVYEGGQHMQPYNQGDWAYNHAVYDAQIDKGMYDLYARNFNVHQEPDVNCKLFMAFSLAGERQSRWGSWGHLESFSQLGQDIMTVAPKYQALLDFNTPKTVSNIRADVNNSSSVTSADALLTMRYALGLSMAGTAWQAGATTGDANCDGKVTTSDALLIMRYSLGLSMGGTAWCGQ